LLIGQGWR